MKRKIIFIALVFFVFLSLQPAMALTSDDFVIVNEGGERILARYAGSGGRVVIPDGVTVIESFAFNEQLNLIEVIMPDTVREIRANAFRGSVNLVNVRFSENLETMGFGAFMWSRSLRNITLPASVQQISGAFSGGEFMNMTIMGDLPPGDSFSVINPLLMNLIIHGDINAVEFEGAFFPEIYSNTFERSPIFTNLVIYGDIYNNAVVPDAFKNNPHLTIHGRAGSNLEAFARENNYRFAVIDEANPPVFNTEPVTVVVDGETLEFDVPPVIVNGRTLVPIRAIFEKMGATVVWEQELVLGAIEHWWVRGDQVITATKEDTTVVLTVGTTSPTVNGRVVPIEQPAVVVNSRTLVPLRFAAEAFGGTVVWDNESRTAHITR